MNNNIENFTIGNEEFSNNKEKQECIIQRAIQKEIDDNVPEHRRTRAWFISCPCPKCSPCYL